MRHCVLHGDGKIAARRLHDRPRHSYPGEMLAATRAEGLWIDETDSEKAFRRMVRESVRLQKEEMAAAREAAQIPGQESLFDVR